MDKIITETLTYIFGAGTFVGPGLIIGIGIFSGGGLSLIPEPDGSHAVVGIRTGPIFMMGCGIFCGAGIVIGPGIKMGLGWKQD